MLFFILKEEKCPSFKFVSLCFSGPFSLKEVDVQRLHNNLPLFSRLQNTSMLTKWLSDTQNLRTRPGMSENEYGEVSTTPCCPMCMNGRSLEQALPQ